MSTGLRFGHWFSGALVGKANAFRVYVIASLLGIIGYFWLPQAAQNVAFVVSNAVAMTVILVVVRRRRLTPSSGWLLLAAFPAATGIGNIVYFINATIRHVAPFPSIGDASFLGGYLLLAGGLLRLQRARSVRRDLSAVLDAGIITVGFAAASWVFFMAKLVHDPTSSLLARLTAVGYPVADVLILAVAVRFFLSSRRRTPVFRWLAATVVVMLVSDTVFAVLNLLGVYSTGNPVDALILTYNLGWGAVVLHRSSADLVRPGRVLEARLNWWRMSALAAASLIAPTVLIVQVVTHQLQDTAVTAGASALLFLLVVARMAGLVRSVELVLRQRRVLESELEHRAHHDDLTGLANRRMFTEHLERAFQERPDSGIEVLFLDLDRFKAINDSLGHGAGDQLLVVIARRLRAALQPGDVIARLGGDEFAVLLGARPTGAAAAVDPATGEAPRLRTLSAVQADLTAAVQHTVPLQGLDLRVSASIGAASRRPTESLEDLMHRADMAMYAQKTHIDRRATAAPASVGRADT